MNVNAQSAKGLAIPFDHHRLDRLMDEAGIDVVLATSKHNVQYLLGGHRADFFDYMDATGVTRYLPVLVYPKGAPEKAAYIGHRLEKFQREIDPMWTPETQTNTWGTVDAMQKAVDHMRKIGLKPKRIATEFGFLPYDASQVLRAAFPDAEWVDALYVLERQRVKKSAEELKLLKIASEAVIDSMQAVIASSKPDTTKAELVPLAVWPLGAATARTLPSINDLALGPDGRVYALSARAQVIARMEERLAPGERASATAVWPIGDGIPGGRAARPEGLTFLPSGRPVVGIDTGQPQDNLVVLRSLAVR